MKICRFTLTDLIPRIGLVLDSGMVRDISREFKNLADLLNAPERFSFLGAVEGQEYQLSSVELLAPVDDQEIWAAGVTYLRSKKARMEESEFSASAYDKVYEAPRPEIFFKSLGAKAVGPGAKVGIRSDARWNVPEPELALVINAAGKIAGYTICNDMSSRDIEGENLLYLPQAKIYKNSCAIGPWLILNQTEAEAREWSIEIKIQSQGRTVFTGKTDVKQIKRSFQELRDYLFRSQEFPNGVILSTGTGVVPDETFTLMPRDLIEIVISGIGTLSNEVETV
jgi:2-dehydro-3-deoxy-D-arabinonate dehydratase